MTSTTEHPRWCNKQHHASDILNDGHSRWELDEPLVGLIQTEYRDRPVLNVGSVAVPVDQAEAMATLMLSLHRPDIADAITRLRVAYELDEVTA